MAPRPPTIIERYRPTTTLDQGERFWARKKFFFYKTFTPLRSQVSSDFDYNQGSRDGSGERPPHQRQGTSGGLKGVFRVGSPVEKLARSPSVGQLHHSRYDSEGRLLRVPRPPHTREGRSSNQPEEHLLSFGPIHSRQVQSPADALSRHRLPDRMVPGSQNLSMDMDNAKRRPVQHGHGCHPIKRSNRTVRLSVPSSPGDTNERSSDGLVPISENLRFSPLRFGPGTHSHSAPTQGGAHRIVTEPRVFL